MTDAPSTPPDEGASGPDGKSGHSLHLPIPHPGSVHLKPKLGTNRSRMDLSTIILVVVTAILVVTLVLSVNGIRQHAADIALQQHQAKDLLVLERGYSNLRSQLYTLGKVPDEPSSVVLLGGVNTFASDISTFHVGNVTIRCLEAQPSSSIYTCTETRS